MLIIPAMDFRGGALARAPALDPRILLARWDGAPWLHVADLDRYYGTGDNDGAVTAVLAAARMPVQLGGGLTAPADVARWLAAGAARVVLGGTPERLTGGARPDQLAVVVDDASAAQAAVRAGIRTLVWRDRARDGTLRGARPGLAGRLLGLGAEVLYAGGVAGLDDLQAIAARGFAGAIVGRALLEERFTLDEALACSA